MKKTGYFILVATCLLFGVSSSATAKQGFYVGVGIPYNTIDGDFDGSSVFNSEQDANWINYLPQIEGAFGINVVVGYGISEHWAVEFDNMRSNHDWKWGTQSGKAIYYNFSINGKYNFTASQTTQPYILVGIGNNDLEIKNGSIDLDTGQVGSGDFSGPGINVGTGIDQYLGQHLCVTLGLMYRFVDYTNVNGVSGYRIDASVKGSGFTLLLGTVYHF